MKEIDYKAIGTKIKYYRNKQHLTQAQLAEKSGVEPSNISHIERGATKVSLPTLFKIANTLNVSLDALVYDSLEKTLHISNKELNLLLSDCNDNELKAIIEMVKSTKTILRKK